MKKESKQKQKSKTEPATSFGNAVAPSMEPLAVSVKEAARLLGVGATYLYECMATKELRSIKMGRRRLIPWDALKEFFQKRKEK